MALLSLPPKNAYFKSSSVQRKSLADTEALCWCLLEIFQYYYCPVHYFSLKFLLCIIYHMHQNIKESIWDFIRSVRQLHYWNWSKGGPHYSRTFHPRFRWFMVQKYIPKFIISGLSLTYSRFFLEMMSTSWWRRWAGWTTCAHRKNTNSKLSVTECAISDNSRKLSR